jgi:CopG-like RHH_1 or ribbon-helix-helix domain, RHH_5
MVPESIDVEVPEEVLEYLQRISDRTGRSISEIAAALVIQGAERFDLE